MHREFISKFNKPKAVLSVILCVGIFMLFYAFSIADRLYLPLAKDTAPPVPDSVLFTRAPILSPEQALQTFQLEEGFSLELVASEPLIEDPVAMTFDSRGRIWVVEMQSYMLDLDGNGEEKKISRIVILEDEDSDGKMDRSKVFLDSLAMPRAIALTEDGVLYAEPPNLWFVENIEDSPGKKTLIDSTYAVDGNAEHQPNGLMRGMDGWYYNAKSKFRYKRVDGTWIKEETEFRGQWGMSMDNFGRLYYNSNSNQLRGDLVPPNRLGRNPNFDASLGINVQLADDQQVYPIRPTPGINRGYREDMITHDNKLTKFTAACGPVIYRGQRYPQAFFENAFVCEPSGNLIKRNILREEGTTVIAEQAYENREFLASTDERFRPVSLYNGPDGYLYLVDMYRGVIQHKTYLTDYLRDQITSRGLEKPLGMGRIYRIKYEQGWWDKFKEKFTHTEPSLAEASDRELLAYLSHPNGWWRDNAQRLLIERNNTAIVPGLFKIIQKEKPQHYEKIHALWTLEGLGIYTPEVIQWAVQSKDPKVVATALRVAERNRGSDKAGEILNIFAAVAGNADPTVQLQLALSLGEFMEANEDTVMELLRSIADRHGNEPLFREAILSSISGKESQFLKLTGESTHTALTTMLEEVTSHIKLKKQLSNTSLTEADKEQYILGKSLYEQTCAGCHGQDGKGLVPIAPPLAGSDWVLGSEERLVLVALHGLKGPVTVNGKVYQEPEVQGLMPGIADNPEFTDQKLAALLTYIRNTWGNQGNPIAAPTVKEFREGSKGRKEPFTEADFQKDLVFLERD